VYEGLIKSKKGRAVAHIKGAACSACGFAIPSGLASRARVGEELVFCVNCERILVP
jgi:predicted  nucleic acid-binding Zn-ribbon protein